MPEDAFRHTQSLLSSSSFLLTLLPSQIWCLSFFRGLHSNISSVVVPEDAFHITHHGVVAIYHCQSLQDQLHLCTVTFASHEDDGALRLYYVAHSEHLRFRSHVSAIIKTVSL